MATIPTAYTWTIGELVTSTKINTYLRDAVSFLLDPPSARLSHSTTQSITTGTDTGMSLNTEAADADGGHSTSSNTSRYAPQTAGVWDLNAAVPFAANATGKREAAFRVNGTTTHHAAAIPAAVASRMCLNLSGKIPLTVGDYVEVVVFQDSGGNLNLDNTFRGGQRLDAYWRSP